jgi:aryl-alcohol dehydrogenase-like predicted oxidoreductase
MEYRSCYDPAPKPMTLGGVQFGLDYGIVNTNGKVPEKDSIAIIRHAIVEGIEYIDTAAAYGDSERLIGKSLADGWSNRVKVITKLFPFNEKELSEKDDSFLSLMVKNSFRQSCENLKVNHLDTFMLHRAQQLNNTHIFNGLKKLKEEGLINCIGVSVQSPQELEFVLHNQDVSIIQMPYNILDYRWKTMIEEIKREREERSLIIHARSALLQGLLCSDDDSKWQIAGIDNSSDIISWLETKYKQHEKMSIADLCISYVNSQEWVDSVVIGVDSKKNLFANLQSISTPLMTNEALNDLISSRPFVNAKALNPANWEINV